MEKWKHKSLEWIHKVREEDYEETKDLSPGKLIETTRRAGEATARNLGLKVIPPKATTSKK